MEIILQIFESANLLFVVLVLGALSGLVSERAGVVNIGIEGMMAIGAVVFALFAKNVGNHLGNWSQILALVIAGCMGMIFASLHAFAAIILKADQIISGVAINILATAITLFIVQMPDNGGVISFTDSYRLISITNSKFFNLYFFLTVILVVLIGVLLKYSKWGLRHNAVGENPSAAAAAGISVVKRRYYAVLLSGFLAALAGGIFTMNKSQSFRGFVDGKGFLALAILIFGQWRVLLITVGASLFALLETATAKIIYGTAISQWFTVNKELLNLLPFVVSILVLVFTSKWSRAPKALGKPFG